MQITLGNAYSDFNDAVWDNWEPANPSEAAHERHYIAMVRRVRARGRGLLVRRAHAAHPQLADLSSSRARSRRCHGRSWRAGHVSSAAGLLVGLALFFPLFVLKVLALVT